MESARLLKVLGFGARLDGAKLQQADFRGARLTNASYTPADLEGALNHPVGAI